MGVLHVRMETLRLRTGILRMWVSTSPLRPAARYLWTELCSRCALIAGRMPALPGLRPLFMHLTLPLAWALGWGRVLAPIADEDEGGPVEGGAVFLAGNHCELRVAHGG